jgi:hypothetical protein
MVREDGNVLSFLRHVSYVSESTASTSKQTSSGDDSYRPVHFSAAPVTDMLDIPEQALKDV